MPLIFLLRHAPLLISKGKKEGRMEEGGMVHFHEYDLLTISSRARGASQWVELTEVTLENSFERIIETKSHRL